MSRSKWYGNPTTIRIDECTGRATKRRNAAGVHKHKHRRQQSQNRSAISKKGPKKKKYKSWNQIKSNQIIKRQIGLSVLGDQGDRRRLAQTMLGHSCPIRMKWEVPNLENMKPITMIVSIRYRSHFYVVLNLIAHYSLIGRSCFVPHRHCFLTSTSQYTNYASIALLAIFFGNDVNHLWSAPTHPECFAPRSLPMTIYCDTHYVTLDIWLLYANYGAILS